ncbi:GRP2 putative NADPH-dependent methylglyoxal reductase GRP2 [Candida maltosa Xu316]|uniref:NADPH-dependent methylglyoxal reductase, putative n=1 Tax=Candida maltosa (strain Xu316) TaxID=1245528 RepID=M3JEN2_CANMX|nr:NADPH-dependent methylglyoxal reductase, putative [Candida maltosa Xu316]
MTAVQESVFVSGANGYIAQHIVKQLLEKNYKVVGSVRSESKGEDLSKLVNSKDFSYVVVPDIAAKGAFDKALETHPDITTFIHTASPVTFSAKDPVKEIVNPAVEGTKNVLNAVKEHGKQVKHLVFTSSVAAVKSPKPDLNKILTEDDWNPITLEQVTDGLTGYSASKTLAERALWEFVKNESPQFKVTAVNPTFVLGPQAYAIKDKSQLNLSADIVAQVLRLKPNDKIEPFAGVFIDVRDVAKAHLVAFEKKEAIGQRLVLINGPFTTDLIADIVKKNVPQAQIPAGDLARSKQIVEEKVGKSDTTRTNKILGFDFISVEKTFVDAAKQFYN